MILIKRMGSLESHYVKKFHLDVGWQLFRQELKFEQAQLHFEKTDIDPREMILLIKDLHGIADLRKMIFSAPT